MVVAMKRIKLNIIVKSAIVAAVVIPGQIQASALTTAQAVSDNQNKFQKQINKASTDCAGEQKSIGNQFAIRAAADKKIAAQKEAANKAAQEKAAKEKTAQQAAAQEKAAQEAAAAQAAKEKAAQEAAAQQAAAAQTATYTQTSYQVSSSSTTSGSYGITGDASKAWIESIESGGNENAANGQYLGLFQLSSQAAAQYGGYSGSAADRYVAARYGSWAAAAAHHRAYGWY